MDKRVSDETLASIAGMARGNLKTSRDEINIVEKLALDEEASRAQIARLTAPVSREKAEQVYRAMQRHPHLCDVALQAFLCELDRGE